MQYNVKQHYTVKKPFCFSFPPENSCIRNRKSRCRYQNNLPAAHGVFLNYPCQEATAGKSGQKQQIRPEIPGLLVPEKVRPENLGKYIQIRPENSAASNCRYGRKIPASNYLIQPENLAASNCRYGRKIRASNYQIRPENLTSGYYRNGRKIPARNRMNVIASYIQGCSGAVAQW